MQLASRNVTVNAVALGYIETDMTHVLSEQAKEAFLSRVPLKRVGTPADVAGAVPSPARRRVTSLVKCCLSTAACSCNRLFLVGFFTLKRRAHHGESYVRSR